VFPEEAARAMGDAEFVSDSDAAAKAQQKLATPVAVKIDAPIHKSDLDAQEMLESLQTYPLLQGYRGKAGGDIDTLKDLMYRIATLAQEVDDLVELDLNPVFVHSAGVTVADVRLAVHTADDSSG